MTNRVELSADCRTMTVRTPAGVVATLRSSRRYGFTQEEVAQATCMPVTTDLRVGQLNRVRSFMICGRRLFVHVNTGPPTWWFPRVQFSHRTGRGEVMIGWLRGLLAVTVQW